MPAFAERWNETVRGRTRRDGDAAPAGWGHHGFCRRPTCCQKSGNSPPTPDCELQRQRKRESEWERGEFWVQKVAAVPRSLLLLLLLSRLAESINSIIFERERGAPKEGETLFPTNFLISWQFGIILQLMAASCIWIAFSLYRGKNYCKNEIYLFIEFLYILYLSNWEKYFPFCCNSMKDLLFFDFVPATLLFRE